MKSILIQAILIDLLLIFTWSVSNAQPECPTEKANEGGIRAIEVTLGPKQYKGLVGSIGAVYYFQSVESKLKNKFPLLYANANLYFAVDEKYGLTHEIIAPELSVGIIPFNIGHIIYPSFKIGGFLSFDNLSSSNDISDDVRNSLSVVKQGGFLGTEVLIFFGHSRLAFLGTYSQRFLVGDHWGDKRVYSGIGFRYHFSDMKKYMSKKSNKNQTINSSRPRYKVLK